MPQYLYCFGFEAPVDREANQRWGSDAESSYAFFVEASSPEDALEWGQEVAEAMVRFIFEKSGWRGAIPSWKADGYAFWIEDDPEEIAQASDCPVVAVGAMPDITTWPDVL